MNYICILETKETVENQEASVRIMFEEIEELADYEDGDGLY